MQACLVQKNHIGLRGPGHMYCSRKKKLTYPLPRKGMKRIKGFKRLNRACSSTVLQVLLQAKKEIATMKGAILYAECQIKELESSNTCISCERDFDSNSEREKALQSFKGRIERAVSILHTSQSNMHRIRFLELSKGAKLDLQAVSIFDAPDFKAGKALAIRSQKQKTLIGKKCTICSKSLSTNELGLVLSKADRNLR